jgi:hypothetical protein
MSYDFTKQQSTGRASPSSKVAIFVSILWPYIFNLSIKLYPANPVSTLESAAPTFFVEVTRAKPQIHSKPSFDGSVLGVG